MYKFYNANAIGNFTDDCVIRAISCATNKSWDYVYDMLSDIAQFEGTMMDKVDFVINYLDNKYYRINTNNLTVGDISDLYDDNILLVTMKGHITCSKYGIVYDTFDCTNRKAEYAWIVK